VYQPHERTRFVAGSDFECTDAGRSMCDIQRHSMWFERHGNEFRIVKMDRQVRQQRSLRDDLHGLMTKYTNEMTLDDVGDVTERALKLAHDAHEATLKSKQDTERFSAIIKEAEVNQIELA